MPLSMKAERDLSPKDNHQPIPIREKFQQAREALCNALVERDEEIDLLLTSLLAGENLLLVGNPGTAKSLLLDSLMAWMGGGKKFSILLTKFSTPEEVFGPVSVQGLKNDQYRRITSGMLPEAELAFIDEIWKASSAILNTTLKILNEKTYDNRPCPLLMCVAASNEWPNDENGGREVNALFDRFLLRKKVKPVTAKNGRAELLKRAVHWNDCKPSFLNHITPEQILRAQKEAGAIPWTDEAKRALWDILQKLDGEGIFPGDRRVYKSVNVARAAAYLDGSKEVQPQHLSVLCHVLWDDPTEQPDKCAKIVLKVCNPTGQKVNEILVQIEDVVSKAESGDAKAVTESVSKLQEIQKQLNRLPKDGRVNKAIAHVKGEIGRLYNKVINVEGSEE